MKIKYFAFVLIALTLVSSVSAILIFKSNEGQLYYFADDNCEPLNYAELKFTQKAFPILYNKPLTETEKIFMDKVYEAEHKKCLKILNN